RIVHPTALGGIVLRGQIKQHVGAIVDFPQRRDSAAADLPGVGVGLDGTRVVQPLGKVGAIDVVDPAAVVGIEPNNARGPVVAEGYVEMPVDLVTAGTPL